MTTTAQARSGVPRLAALEHRSFRLYWGGATVSLIGTMAQQAAVAWQVYLLSHSALALGLIGLFRVAPIVLFSLAGGVVADVVNRRVLLIGTQTVLLVVSACLALITISNVAALWMVYVLSAIAGAASAFDNPARQAMIPSLIPRDRLTNALSLMSTAWQFGAVVGPSLAGIVIASSGVAAVYGIDVVSYLAVIAALYSIHVPHVMGGIQKITVKAAIEGLRFVRRTPIILSTMALDFVATFFGSAIALLPIFARDILHVGSQGYGLLYAAPAAGAVVTGVVMSFYSGTIHHKGRVILIAVGCYGLFTILFGVSHIFVLSLIALAGTGASDTVSMILRNTVRQTVTPDQLRGRMTSVNMVFFMGGPQLGEFEAGVVARAFGAPFSVISGGIAAVLATCLIAARAGHLRRYVD